MRYNLARLLFVASLAVTIVLGDVAQGYSNGAGNYRGYFTNTDLDRSRAHENVLVDCNGNDIFDATFTDKARFIGTVKDYLADGRLGSCSPNAYTDTQNRTGAAFLIQAMRASVGPTARVRPSAADIADWESRINSSSVTISFESYTYTYNSGYLMASDTIDDDGFYDRGGTANSLVFRDRGVIVVAIKADCANMNGGVGLSALNAWQIQGASAVDRASAQPGQSVTFSHSLNNLGPSQAMGVSWTVRNQVGAAVASNGPISMNVGWMHLVSVEPFTIPATAVPGQQFCRRIEFSPSSYNPDLGLSSSVPACVTVAYDYTLTPTVNSSTSTVKTGDSITFNYAVRNEPGGSATFATSYLYRSIVVPPAAVLPASFFSQKDSIAGCGVYTAAAPGITCVDSLPINNVIFPAGVSNTPAGSRVVVASYPSGTRICQALSITPRNASRDAAQNRDSTLSCVLVAASPYLAAVGGTVWSGGSVDAPYNSVVVGGGTIRGVASASFGSFGDYGVFATGVVSNFGSASLLTGSALTFANTPSFGSFTSTHKIENMVDYYRFSPDIPGVVNAGRIVASGVYKSPADLTLQSTVIPPGVNAVIYAPGRTVTIAGNISFGTGGVTRFAQLPSLTIIASNIQINGVVQRVDANLYGSQTIVTCSEGPRRPVDPGTNITTTGACSQQLTINGSVTVANQAVNSLVLNRSYGGAAVGQASEIIRLRPEAFLTAHELNVTSSSTVMNVVKETELPARY